MGMQGTEARKCELCSEEAALHCEADSAYLCRGCDVTVHGANFLVARHSRMILCCRCYQSTDKSVSGSCAQVGDCLCCACSTSQYSDQTSLYISTAESGVTGPVSNGSSSHEKPPRDSVDVVTVSRPPIGSMRPCLGAANDEEGASTTEISINEWSYGEDAASSFVSQKDSREATSEKERPPKQEVNLRVKRERGGIQNAHMKLQTIMRGWSRCLNLRNHSTVDLAMHLVEKGLHKFGALFRQKWRTCLAACLWLAATLCENQANLPSVKRLEECTGISSKLILLVECKLAAVLDCKMQKDASEEGWAESSVGVVL